MALLTSNYATDPAWRGSPAAVAARPGDAAKAASQAVLRQAANVSQARSIKAAESLRDHPRLAEQLSAAVAQNNELLDLTIDPDTGNAIVRIVDRETKEVLLQFPAEEMLEIARSLGKTLGVFVQQHS